MLESKNIEDELEFFLSRIDKELSLINTHTENLQSLKSIISINNKDASSKHMNLSKVLRDMDCQEILIENLSKIKFYRSLIEIQNEEKCYNKLGKFIELVIFFINFF